MAVEDLPSRSILKKVADFKVYDKDGNGINFQNIYESDDQKIQRIMIIFIRHFFCGNCQEYIRQLIETIPAKSLPIDLSIKIIGCGAPSLIQSYIELTNCPYPIYADPSTKLYDTLGMHRSLSLGHKSPEYIQHSLFIGMLKSIVQGVKRIPTGDVLAAGNLNVNGGEFLFIRDGNESSSSNNSFSLKWCYKMKNSRDHTEIQQLQKILGLIDNDIIQISKSNRRSTINPSKNWIKRTQSLRRSNTTKANEKLLL